MLIQQKIGLSLETHNTKLIANRIVSVQEKPKNTDKKSSTKVSKEKSNNTSKNLKNARKNGNRAAEVTTSETEDIIEKLIEYEGGGHVLVPGLPPVIPTEEANEDEEIEMRIHLDGSNGAFEAKDLNLPEATA